MEKKNLFIKLFALVTAMMCALGAIAAEAYACYTPSNETLTFYYDNYRTSRTGTTYNLNTGTDDPDWAVDGISANVNRVVFNSSFANARPTSTYSWFYDMEILQTITGMSYLNTSQVTDMTWMFGYCTELTSLDVSSFNTSQVTNMSGMFYGCSSLTSLDLSSFNTSQVTTMAGMFRNCSSLTSLDLSSFNTSKVTRMGVMFNSCRNLRTIYVGDGWSTAAVTNSTNMFTGCTSLVGGQGTTYDPNHIDSEYAHIDGGPNNPGYFTEKPKEAYACFMWSNTTLTFYYDTQRSHRTGSTYDLNTGDNEPGWFTDNTCENVTKVIFDPSFTDARPTSTCCWFGYMPYLQSITGMSYLNTSEVTDMSFMFQNCNQLTSLDVSNFNTSKVTNMAAMFYGCNNLSSLDLSSFNTSKVTNMYGMFYECGSLRSLDLSSFNTSKVTNMACMFESCNNLSNLDLSSFNTSKVTSMGYMFECCDGLRSLDLSSFNTSQVTNMSSMFSNIINLQTIYVGNGWSTAAVTYSDDMFYNCTSLVGGQGTTYNPSYIDKTYAHIDGGTSNPGYFTDVNAPRAYACYTPSNTTLTFYYDTQHSSRPGTIYDLNSGSPGWYNDGTFMTVTQAVFDPSFADARPTTTSYWFYNMGNLQSITGMSYLNTIEVTSMGSMFFGCNQLTSIDVSHFFTINVSSMSYMFCGCSNLTSLDLGSFRTSQVINMMGMFAGCSSLTSLDLSTFNTSQVTSMYAMFYGCSNLTSLDLSTFRTSKVTDMENMFDTSSNLRTIYVDDGWSTAAVTSSTDMFNGCTRLVGGQGTTYDENHVDAVYAHIDGGPSNPGYFTEFKEAYACYTPSNTTLTFYYDTLRSSRPVTTYDLNTGHNEPGWETDGTYANVTKVVFDPSFANARPTTTCDWFYYMSNLQSITGMSNLNTSEVTDMEYMFVECSSLTSLDLSHFNTSKVTIMYGMFSGCSSLTSLDLSSFNTSQVTDMYGVFFDCSGLTSLDLSSFNTSKVTDMRGMFYNCNNLRTVYVGNGWSTAAVTDSYHMFYDCTSLVGGQGTTYNASNPKDKTYAHIDGGPSNPGYFTEKPAFKRGDVNGDGIVDISDVTMLISAVLGNQTVDSTVADMNGDNVVDVSDVTALIALVLNG